MGGIKAAIPETIAESIPIKITIAERGRGILNFSKIFTNGLTAAIIR